MDEPKSLQKNAPVGFLEERALRSNPFGDNLSGERAYRRAERISLALHLLTNHVAEDEPVRRSLRDAGLDLLVYILAARDEMRTRSIRLSDVHACIRRIISLVRILAVSGHVSVQNADMVVEAADDLGEYLRAAKRTMLSESRIITREELIGHGEEQPRSAPAGRSTVSQKDISIKDIKSSAHVSVKNRAMRSRGEEILSILKTRGELGIKDIAVNFPEYGEKTIQRELASLIALGRIKKVGSKRWSRYLAG